MPTFHFTKWVKPFLKYLLVSVGVYKYQHTHNKETFHSGKFLVHFQSLSSIDIYMQMLLDWDTRTNKEGLAELPGQKKKNLLNRNNETKIHFSFEQHKK